MKSIYLNIKRKMNAGLLVKAGGVVLMAAFVLILTTQSVHAEFIEFNTTKLVLDGLANLMYSLQTIASWLIYLAGSLLNFSINLTMHIKEFVSSTDSVYSVWKAIRDISGMFIIFSLLYAAILLIVSYEKPKFGKLLINIVVAGVLINFSFFLTGLAIDVSNIVSLQLYNAIAPQAKMDGSLNVVGNVASNVWDNVTLKGYMQKSSADGGLSTIFMQALGVTRLYNPDGSISSAGQKVQDSGSALIGPSMKIILTGVTSIIIMITAALSFFAAALAFMVRFVILIFLLAFSPILFASYVVPEIDEYVGKWRKYLKSQLIFMPVYLLLMYVALSVVTSSSIFKEGYASSLSGNGGFLADLMILAVNAVLIILMLNFPLLGAISMGAMMPEWAKKMGAEDIWRRVGGVVGRGTVGSLGSSLDKRLANTRLGNTSLGRDIRSGTTGALAKSKFGSSRSYEEQAKINEDVMKQRKLIEGGNTEADKARKAKARNSELTALIENKNTAPNLYKDIIKKMSEKEKLALGGKNLKNIEVLKHLKKSDFEAIKKSDDISDEDKVEIGNLRLQALRECVDNGFSQSEYAEHMIKNMETDDIMKLETSYLTDPFLIAHLTAGQLKKMADEKLDATAKQQIGDVILDWTTNAAVQPLTNGDPHHAYGFIRRARNQGTW